MAEAGKSEVILASEAAREDKINRAQGGWVRGCRGGWRGGWRGGVGGGQ